MWESRSARLESQTSNLLAPHPAALRLRSQLGHSAEWGEEQGEGQAGLLPPSLPLLPELHWVGGETVGLVREHPEAGLLNAPQESKIKAVSLGGSGQV